MSSSALLLVLAGAALLIPWDRILGDGDESAVPARPSSLAAPTPTPTPALAATSTPTSQPTVVITVTAQPTPTTGPATRPVPIVTQPAAPGPIAEDEALASVHAYLATVAGNPSAGWDLLSHRRQQVEDRASYQDYWGSIRSAIASDVTFDGQRVEFTLHATGSSGRMVTSDAAWWVTREDGIIKVDLPGISAPEQEAAEQTLQDYRDESLAGLTYDERWVLVLSAKRPGMTDPLQVATNGSHTFYAEDIVSLHERLAGQLYGTPMLMLRTQDFGKQGGAGLWFTIADPGGLASEDNAASWCASAFPELTGQELANQCLPRRMRAPYYS